ncbi:HD domain-containing protein [Sphaerobacter sp.]|uniref:HD domain-containing protein n=1 Tax=Sphaerobacter sp. TaxID=2099654 RepID=UPI001D4F6993|nr:HD domain-containing protein [Sphaerobacter sp.]MBX5444984.1 HDIG domain-containing protein [Sphaerobacter sp.]
MDLGRGPLRTGAARPAQRVVQFFAYIRPRRGAVDRELRRLVTPEQWALLARLSRADRAHLLEVHRRLVAEGCRDRDVLLAALLHDVGKADGRARTGVSQRVVSVLLGRFAPGLLTALARPDRDRWRHGLYLAREHARLGAEQARQAGCSERVCWLIAHHHDRAAEDPDLRLLQAADEGMGW